MLVPAGSSVSKRMGVCRFVLMKPEREQARPVHRPRNQLRLKPCIQGIHADTSSIVAESSWARVRSSLLRTPGLLSSVVERKVSELGGSLDGTRPRGIQRVSYRAPFGPD